MPRPSLSFLLAIPLGTLAACRDVSRAPDGTPRAATPYVTYTLDRMYECSNCPFEYDVANSWGGITILLPADQSVHIVALDLALSRVRYHGCANVCDDTTHWFGGTGDTASATAQESVAWLTAVATPGGIRAMYGTRVNHVSGVRYVECPGACNFGRNWTGATLFVDRGIVAGGTGQNISLAADAAGGLHLVLGGLDNALRYAYCAAACGAESSWQLVVLDSLVGDSHNRLIAVDARSGVHVLYRDGADLIHASCAADCTSPVSWRSGVAAVGPSVRALSLAFGSDGRLELAYADSGQGVHYGQCTGPCSAPGSWSFVALPLTAVDLSVAARGGTTYVATTPMALDPPVVLSRCHGGCLAGSAWQSMAIDSALGGGHVSVAIDSSGFARIASTTAHNHLQYTRMLE